MNRRNFVTWFGLGGLVSFLSTAIAACSNGTKVGQSTTFAVGGMATKLKSGEFVKIGTAQTLKQDGRILFKDANTSALVLRDPSNPSRALAVKPVCTHKGCAVDWSADESEILCPCHGSTFKPDGTVIKGPATKPLERYEAKIEGDAILVKIS
jgi:cytochrome b6-f complex iron-sulfur subunit